MGGDNTMSRAEFKFYGLKLNTKSDKDIIDFLEAYPNKQGAIKNIIRAWFRYIKYDPNKKDI